MLKQENEPGTQTSPVGWVNGPGTITSQVESSIEQKRRIS